MNLLTLQDMKPDYIRGNLELLYDAMYESDVEQQSNKEKGPNCYRVRCVLSDLYQIMDNYTYEKTRSIS